MYARVTISLSEQLLERLDDEALAAGSSRSELVQESISAYLGKTAEQRADAARRRGMLDALEGMRTFHTGRGVQDDRPSIEILREIRRTDDSAPLHDLGTDRP
jgi:predicted transcriptional regulator